MKFYSETLSAIFAILSGESAPKVLMLIANGEISDVPDRPDGLRRFELPASMIPRGADQRCLASGESFVEQSLSVIAASDAKCVFVFPPFIGDRWLSEEWRERFGRLGIPEILAASLVGDATSAQAHLSAERSSQVQALAMLVPSYFIASLRSSRWRQFFPAHSAVVIEHEQPIMAGAQGLPVPTLVHFSTVVFRRQPGPIRFFKITEAAAAQGVQQLVSVEEYTIEHIMPQNENLSPAWQADLGEKWQEVHNRYLHTLGNLTLTGYNSEYSDRPFKEKRDMKGGFAESPIRLNEGLGALEVWNEFEIQKRGERLAGGGGISSRPSPRRNPMKMQRQSDHCTTQWEPKNLPESHELPRPHLARHRPSIFPTGDHVAAGTFAVRRMSPGVPCGWDTLTRKGTPHTPPPMLRRYFSSAIASRHGVWD
ncbi:MAG TPA: HNH endonuclease family protein [Tepidisphaeraceae bacterium]|nr:HNH endonuclease family protein [Tepidisphaeraceae bacterium]